jgi:uncharacterized damage-inducible protein DinB
VTREEGSVKEGKDGRLRRYDLKPFPGAATAEIGEYVAVLEELGERVFDQISDLPEEALAFVPEGSYLSIGKLVLHLVSGEARGVSRITGQEIPPDLAAELSGGGRDQLGRPLEKSRTAAELIALGRRVREEMTQPHLSRVTDLDAPIQVDRGPNTVKQMLMQLIWHSIYHSGHIGLTRLLWGSDYNWRY